MGCFTWVAAPRENNIVWLRFGSACPQRVILRTDPTYVREVEMSIMELWNGNIRISFRFCRWRTMFAVDKSDAGITERHNRPISSHLHVNSVLRNERLV